VTGPVSGEAGLFVVAAETEAGGPQDDKAKEITSRIPR
jgi:hypothetical protein